MKKYLSIARYILFITSAIFVCLYNYLQPTVSVVLPTYNRAHLLPRAIDSILNQTFQDFELIIVDDGSTDKSTELLKKYQKKSNKIKVIRHTVNQGVATARNSGNTRAKGKYIAIMDSDDYAYPDFLKKAVEYMEKNSHVVLGIPTKKTFIEKDCSYFEECPSWMPAQELPPLLLGNFIGNVGNIIRHDFIKKHHITYKQDYACGEDYDFWIQIILNNGRIEKIPTTNPLVATKYAGGLSTISNCTSSVKLTKENLYQKINYSFNEEAFDTCTLYQKTIKKFPNIFPKNVLRHISNYCPKEQDIFIKLKHTKWQDYLIFETGASSGHRSASADSADILLFVPNKKITLKWHNYGEETFIFDKEKQAYVFEESVKNQKNLQKEK